MVKTNQTPHILGGSAGLPWIGSLYPFIKKCAKFIPETIVKKIPFGDHVFFVKHEEHIEGLYDLNKENNNKYPGNFYLKVRLI